MRTMMALLSAACLCAHAAVAHAQSTSVPAKPASTPTTASGGKQGLKPPKRGVDLKAMEGDSEGCPRGPNGEEECTVEVTGPSAGWSGGLASGGGWGGGGDPGMCTPGKQLQASPCTPDTPGAKGPDPSEKEKAKERARAICHSDYQEDLKNISDDFNAMVEKQCGNLAQLKIGFKFGSIEAELDRIGSVIEELGRPFGRTCLSTASEIRNGAVAQKRETRRQCLANAEKG